ARLFGRRHHGVGGGPDLEKRSGHGAVPPSRALRTIPRLCRAGRSQGWRSDEQIRHRRHVCQSGSRHAGRGCGEMGDRRVAENLRLTCRAMIYLSSARRSRAAQSGRRGRRWTGEEPPMAISEAVGQRAFAQAPRRGFATRLLEDERWLAVALLVPTVVLLGMFIAYPFVQGVLLAVTDTKVGVPGRFVGE